MNWRFWNKEKKFPFELESEVEKEIRERNEANEEKVNIEEPLDSPIENKEQEVENMAEVLLSTQIKRESGFLYFCGTDKNGNITVNKAKMARGRKKKK